MFKKICMAVIMAALAALAMAACGDSGKKYAAGGEAFRVANHVNVFLNAGEEIELDIEELFEELYEDSAPEIKKIEVSGNDIQQVFNIKNNKIRGDRTGIAVADISIERADAAFYNTFAIVHILDYAEMTEVKTAQDLASMSYGSYILKNDIDLAEFGEWTPLRFGGIFVNPDGYKIKNLTVNTPLDTTIFGEEIYKTFSGGLFAYAKVSYIDGIILEDVCISAVESSDSHQYLAGALCGESYLSTISNCVVTGSVAAKTTAGGIVGKHSGGRIVDCSFSGTVEHTSVDRYNYDYGAGGIVGQSLGGSRMINCTVDATITGHTCAGGMLGHYTGQDIDYDKIINDLIKNCSFEGELTAPHTDDKCGLVGSV